MRNAHCSLAKNKIASHPSSTNADASGHRHPILVDWHRSKTRRTSCRQETKMDPPSHGWRELVLRSPFGCSEPITYKWPLTNIDISEVNDIIKILSREYREMHLVIGQKFKRSNGTIGPYWTDFKSVEEFFALFNKLVETTKKINKGVTKPGAHKGTEYLRQILTNLAYRRAIPDPEVLNKHYAAFSSQTYGETTFDRVDSVIKELDITDKDVFVDLGSGVGNVVLQVAGGSKCKKSVGIEIANIPAEKAKALENEFSRWMKWFDKKWRPFELIHDDFLNSKHHELITKEATIIFINNFAFTADLECKIRLLLGDLQEGTRIVSTKPYASVDSDRKRKLTARHLESAGSDLTALLDVVMMKPVAQSTSWTCNTVAYYLHTVNPRKIAKYFEEIKHGRRSESPKLKANLHRENITKVLSTSHFKDSEAVMMPPTKILQARAASVQPGSAADQQSISPRATLDSPKLKLKESSKKKHKYKHEKDKYRSTSHNSVSPSSKTSSRESSVSRSKEHKEAKRAKKHEHSNVHVSSSTATAATTSGNAGSDFFGPTTRRQWNAWVEQHKAPTTHATPKHTAAASANATGQYYHQHEEKKKSKPREPEPLSLPKIENKEESPVTDNGIEEDEYQPAMKVKRSSVVPAKIKGKSSLHTGKHHSTPTAENSPEPKVSSNTSQSTTSPTIKTPSKKLTSPASSYQETLEKMQELAQSSIKRTTSPGLHVSALRHSASLFREECKPDFDANITSTFDLVQALNSRPQLRDIICKMTKDFISLTARFDTPEFKDELENELRLTQKKHDDLVAKRQRMVEQIERLKKEGTYHLQERLQELNMVAHDPASLMAQSKEIVLRHEELKAELLDMTNEIFEEERKNTILVNISKEKDEAILNSGVLQQIGIAGVDTIEQAKMAILGQMAQEFQLKYNSLEEKKRLESEMVVLQSNITQVPNELVQQAINDIQASTQGGKPVNGHHAPVPKRPRQRSKRDPLKEPRPKKQMTPAQILNIDATIAQVTADGLNQTKSHVTVPTTSSAAAPSTVSLNPTLFAGNTPVTEAPADDIEQQVRSFVSVALQVDERAKREEKERKQKANSAKRQAKRAAAAAANDSPKMTPPTSQVVQLPAHAPVVMTSASKTSEAIEHLQQTVNNVAQLGLPATDTFRMRQQSGESTETVSAPHSPRLLQDEIKEFQNIENAFISNATSKTGDYNEERVLRIDDPNEDLMKNSRMNDESGTNNQ